jgi:hypothetical protein
MNVQIGTDLVPRKACADLPNLNQIRFTESDASISPKQYNLAAYLTLPCDNLLQVK